MYQQLVHIYHLSSCHWTTPDANYGTICVLFIAMTTSCLEEYALAYEFRMIHCSYDFLQILVN